MVTYNMDLNNEKKEAAIRIALESKENVRRRKVAAPLLAVLGVALILIGIFLSTRSPSVLGCIYLAIGIISLLIAVKMRVFQAYVLRKAESLLDKSVRSGVVEYRFDADGVETISQLGHGTNYWTAFKAYGEFGQYLYLRRKDNRLILVDRNELADGELEELTLLLSKNVNREA